MSPEPDNTVPIAWNPKLRPRRVAAAVIALAALLSATAWLIRPAAAPPPESAVTSAAVAPTPALPSLSEAEILARAPGRTEAYRFDAAPDIVVLDFATPAQQGSMLNRAVALIEKRGFPRDRVVSDTELDAGIRAQGNTPETFVAGHDYRAADILRFLYLLDYSGYQPTEGEATLIRLVQEWNWHAGTVAALISLVQPNLAEPNLDPAARATILRHELSHGLYFTSPAYQHYAATFWEETLTEDERARFRNYLAGKGYDTSLRDLVVNETQAYLMHTADPRFFRARTVGIPERQLDALRITFLKRMPPGWLRDRTTLPAPIGNPYAPQ